MLDGANRHDVKLLEKMLASQPPAVQLARAAWAAAAAESGEFDMVALIARPRSFFGELFHRSVTAAVLLHSPVPVLVLPAR